MHADHATFLAALETKHHVTVTFFHAKAGGERVVTCAPLDFGPLRGAHDARPRYQLWDVGAKRPPFNVTILPGDLRSIAQLETTFDPAAIIRWDFKPNAWSHPRDWGQFS
ncbi:MAG: hypothetical protein IPF92_22430 [Myxococcales bacterium]|nr:hypothetical protein [Myxococcales bacterium]MBL0194600.1 hypothetical protein [Myxococcales bacterium]HQY65458.1 hypothetical protein [Polyangiaceae bacterium]